ncbi:hypothetical protein AMTRI_Chr09g34540 [Amborella trichopoda]|uniref:Uncharacterized protein n=1 Tax=Amborella trichopoda TaxID=13333 RepID=W1NLV6_AMBTC|nr:transcription initiation factor IIF subunit beta [Amborella trichopoda]ERM96200.1 hypothetical protein AMTR_s00001p00109570 [Amborella trichopoda]|eukprot:XP_006828784.1 transcription initiation factor IIF subunit beta [Amborella trichopoda]
MSDELISDNGTIDTAKADRSVWLMKCPQLVANAWQNHHDPSLPLAKVVVSVDPLQPDSPASLQFTMDLAATDSTNIPKSYSLNMFKDFVPMCVFSETNQGRVSVEGKVEHKFDMKPNSENMEQYGKLCRERTNKSMIKVRQMQMIDDDRGGLMRPMHGMLGFGSNSKDKKKILPIKGQEMKRTRRDRGELEDIMFKLFERQPNWGLKQLIQETDQPSQFLKEILNELCIYNKRGPHQGTYELKPEYKKSAEEADAE